MKSKGTMKQFLIIIMFMFLCVTGMQAQTPAFPTAEGYGMWASGGRGGHVVEVTTLEDDGKGNITGSLRWALKQHAGSPITIVFRVSGIIDLNGVGLRSKRNNITIAGQTAPGDGICIRGGKCNFGGSTNLIIRHIRFRIGLKELGNGATEFIEGGSIGIENASNWIIDHCTFGWSGEENMTIYDNTLTTVQWCLVHEGLYDAGHGKGVRGYGAQWGGQTSTYHHNLLANNVSRTPRVNGSRSNDINVLMDYVNNVNYNWGKSNSAYGGDLDNNGITHKCNMINNYYKPGPARPGSSSSYFVQSSFHKEQSTSKIAQWYMDGNFMEGSANVAININNYFGLDAHYYTEKGIDKSALISTTPFEVPYQLNVETAQDAYVSVLANAGAFPRDAVDQRIVSEVTTGIANFGGSYRNGEILGIIDTPSQAGGYPEYQTYNTITDNDHDGMDDAWETENGLDPTNAEDQNKFVKSGYTCLEVYLNSLVDENIELNYSISESKVHDILVALDGTGDYTSINDAINAVPDDGQRYTIFLKKGTYREKVFIGDRWQTSNKVISLIGENVDSVIIVWDDFNGKQITYPGKEGTITADGMTCPTMTITSPDFYMENITVKNPSTDEQAVALYQTGDRQVLKNCKILGNQDTHRTKKGRRFFYFRCTIEGGVDFIYSGGTCYFYQCEIVSNRNGYITAPEDITYKATLSTGETLRYGFFFKDCDLLAKESVADGSVYLGRPWQPECGSIFLNCRMGKHINSKGWTTMGAGNEKTACFGEYESMNADSSALIDVSQRIDWSMQLNTTDVNNLMMLSKIYSKVSSTVFDPVPTVVAPVAPLSLEVKDGNRVIWTSNSEAKGYVIYANDTVIGFSKINQYVDTLSYQTPPKYNVRQVGELGNLSPFIGERQNFTYESIIKAIDTEKSTVGIKEIQTEYQPKIVNGIVYFDCLTNLKIYTAQGQVVYSEDMCTNFDIDQLKEGLYIFMAVDEAKNVYSFKVCK